MCCIALAFAMLQSTYLTWQYFFVCEHLHWYKKRWVVKFVGTVHYWHVIQILVNGLQERAMHMISFESKLLKADVIMLSFAVFSVWDNFERGLKKLLMVSEMLT